MPSIVLVYFFSTQDRFPEPKKLIITTFILGILITIPAYFFNTYLSNYIYLNHFNNEYYYVIDNFFVGPFVEEILKFLVVLFFCYRLSDFDEPMDGLVYGATAALGFAMMENFLYVYRADNFLTTWQDIAWTRAFLTAPMHAACGIFIGFSFSYYKFYNKNILFLFIGLLVAILFHHFYNYGYFEYIVIFQILILFFLFKNLRKKQALVKRVWNDESINFQKDQNISFEKNHNISLESPFKKLVILEFLIFIIGIILGFFFADENLNNLQENLNSDSFLIQSELYPLFGIMFLIIYLISLYMIYKFKRLGRILYLISFLFYLFFIIIDGNVVLSSVINSFNYIEAIITGAILSLIYLSPLKEKFDKSNN